ncbi:MAG: hypothetical protein E4H19_05500 [Chromatiales bacterium]|nr:MAG: hypothetical protein E4H19_05500 [Chromatiales bacterium]
MADVIGAASADFIDRGLHNAADADAQLVVIELDTPGDLNTSITPASIGGTPEAEAAAKSWGTRASRVATRPMQHSTERSRNIASFPVESSGICRYLASARAPNVTRSTT